MNYAKIYSKIVESRLLEKRSRKDGKYYESHHIIPKSHGGSDRKENRILLTPREHFICHRLLCKIYPDCPKMKLAIYFMSHNTSNSAKDVRISSRLFEKLKLESAAAKMKLAGFTDNRVEFKTPVVSPRGLATKCRCLGLLVGCGKTLRAGIIQLITNLLSASDYNGMIYSRDSSFKKVHKKSISVNCLIKAIDVLEKHGYIDHNRSMRAERKRSIVYHTDKLIEDFSKYKDEAIKRCNHSPFV